MGNSFCTGKEAITFDMIGGEVSFVLPHSTHTQLLPIFLSNMRVQEWCCSTRNSNVTPFTQMFSAVLATFLVFVFLVVS